MPQSSSTSSSGPYYEVSTANMAATNNTLSITGGQGNYPLAFIETDKT